MGATERQLVRMLVPDKRKIMRNIHIGTGDGNEDIFRVPVLTVDQQVAGTPDLTISLFDPDSSEYQDGIISNFDFDSSDVQLNSAPASGIVIIAYFSYVTFTDAEIDLVLSLPEIANCKYLCAAFFAQSIIADTTRFVSFSQGDARYNFDRMEKRLREHIKRLWAQTTVIGDSIAVPFNPDVLSRVGYVSPPIVRATTPFYRF